MNSLKIRMLALLAAITLTATHCRRCFGFHQLVGLKRRSNCSPLTSVRLLDSPFAAAAVANRVYMLDLDTDRLLAPFRRKPVCHPQTIPMATGKAAV